MHVFFTKLPQPLSLCRAKFDRKQPRLSAAGSVFPYSSFADSQPFRHITDVEQTLGLGGKWRRFKEFERWRSDRLVWVEWLALASSGVFDRECGTPVTRSGIDRGAVRTLLCRPEGDFLQMNPVRNGSFRSSQARERA